MSKEMTDTCMRIVEQLDYLIMKVFSDVEEQKYSSASVGLGLAIELMGKLKKVLKDDCNTYKELPV